VNMRARLVDSRHDHPAALKESGAGRPFRGRLLLS
jgi:hypothetical protein